LAERRRSASPNRGRPFSVPRLTLFFFAMLILRGSQALSDSRLETLRQSLVSTGLPVQKVGVVFVHLVETQHALQQEQLSVLERLLTYGPTRPSAQENGLLKVVAPRSSFF